MRADARTAVAGLAPGSPWSATALLLEGFADVLAGEVDRADPILAHAAEVATHIGAPPAASAALAQRALVAIARQDWIEAETLAERALEIARAMQLSDYEMSPLLHAVAARTALHRGDVSQAQDHLTRADRLRPRLTAAVPHRAVQTLLELARPRCPYRRGRRRSPAPGDPIHPSPTTLPRHPSGPGRAVAIQARHTPRDNHQRRDADHG